jgi:excisionase family DNA binding protein
MSVTSNGLSEDRSVTRVAYSAVEAAQKLGVSEASIWRATRRGQLKAIKFGGRTLITAVSVEKVLEVT